MSAAGLLLLGALGTYLVRVLFIGIVPAHRLPAPVRRVLPLVGPAALAALVATELGHAGTHPGALWPSIASVVIGSVIARLTRNLALTILGGFAAALVVSFLQ